MTNRAAQIAAEYGNPTVLRRGRRFVEFDAGGGRRRFVTTIEPLHYGANADQPVDDAWQQDTGAWQWRMVSNRFNLHARSVLNAGSLVEWLDVGSGQTVTVQPLGLNWVNNANDSRQQIALPQAVTAEASDNVLYWPNGYGTGRHFRYTSHPRRLIKEVIIDSPANLPAPTVANPYLEVEFVITKSSGATYWVNGSAWDNTTKVATSDRIEVRPSAGGEPLWYFDKPIARDAAGNTCPAIFQMRRQGATRYCTVRVPKAWVDAAVFPISIDPTFTDGPGGDTTTARDTNVYWETGGGNKNYGASTYLYALAGGGQYVWRSLLAFHLASIPSSATCDSATLSLYNYAVDAGSSDVSFYPIASANGGWVEGGGNDATAQSGECCWNYRAYNTTAWAGSAGLSTAGTDYTNTACGSYTHGTQAVGYEYQISLTTSVVKAWFGQSANPGMLGIETSDNWEQPGVCSSDHATSSYRPKLVVVYTEAAKSDMASLIHSRRRKLALVRR